MNFKLLLTNTGVLRIDDGAYVPADPMNVDWQSYQAWLVAGNIPIPADPPIAPLDLNDFQNLSRAFRAKCISDLAFRLGVAPGTLTPTQIQAERTRIKAIADALS